MSLHLVRLACLSFAALASSTVRADIPIVPHPPRDTVTHSFEDEIVDGSQRSSHLELVNVRTRKAKESLIRVREHFIPELYKSLEAL